MEEQIITTKRGTFGRLQVTLPMSVKSSITTWIRRSGMGKSEFLRVALMIGASSLAEQVKAKKPDEGYQVENYQNTQPVIRREEDEQLRNFLYHPPTN
jgi:hypothetical protein